MSLATRAFIRQYVEMVVAMFAGMLVLGLPIALIMEPASETIRLLNMAVAMTVPMVAWMRYRGREYEAHAHHAAVAA